MLHIIRVTRDCVRAHAIRVRKFRLCIRTYTSDVKCGIRFRSVHGVEGKSELKQVKELT